MAAVATVSAAVLGAALPMTAQAVQATQATVPNAVPATYTPDVKNGTVYSFGQVGTRTIVGGTFTSVAPHGSTTAVARKDLFAFDPATGDIDAGFAAQLDGEVDADHPGRGQHDLRHGAVQDRQRQGHARRAAGCHDGSHRHRLEAAGDERGPATLALDGDTLYVGGGFTKVGWHLARRPRSP